MSLSSFFSSFLSVVHADAPEEKEEAVESTQVEEVEQAAEEEEEPEDFHPVIRDECKNTVKCAPLTRHFEHCQEKVSAGDGFKGEDCVEELNKTNLATIALDRRVPVHMMHCVDACAGPKLFGKLK